MFNLLKQGMDGLHIWTEAELDATLTLKNKAFIDLERIAPQHWKGFTVGLNEYYRDPMAGTILSNHIFTFGDSDSPTIFKRQEYRDAAAEEYDLLPTSRSSRNCVLLSAEERAEDIQALPDALDTLPAPGLTAEKANECQHRIHPFAPTDEAKAYYNRMTPELRAEIEDKKAAKNRARAKKKKKAKKAKLTATNKNDRW